MNQFLFNIAVIGVALSSVLLVILLVITNIINVPLLALFRSLFFCRPGAINIPAACANGAKIEDATRIAGRDKVISQKLARAWASFCDVSGSNISPVYSFPMVMEIIFDKVIYTDSFPLSLIGVIHTKHVVTQFQPMPEAFSYSLAVTAVRSVETGSECDLSIEIFSSSTGEIANRTVCTFSSTDALKAKKARKSRQPLTESEKLAKTALNKTSSTHTFPHPITPTHSLSYAAASLDSNPIHHPRYCKLMGMNAPIMHGMYTLSRSVALAFSQYSLSETYPIKIQCQWKLPLPVPSKNSTIIMGELIDEVQGWEKGYERNIEFLCFRENRKGEKLPHLRGIISHSKKE
ncbi:hypothetical protein TrVE_jg10898 [Triparma verrucosa]|uniref:MaoC-like domain-containing protein n=1 Tax=Triparma verrucosa TaxID=1606542 RepID=A0A9W7FKR0_9STRA|nr:hypothetical protein TrVE_jg10898 [Triparma verrucosa]